MPGAAPTCAPDPLALWYRGRAQPPSYALIETLAVITLLTLGVTLLTPLLANAGEGSRLRAAELRFLDLDARARLHAPHAKGARLRHADEVWILTPPAEPAHEPGRTEPISVWSPPRGITVELHDEAGGAIDTIRFDAAGRSADYTLLLAHDDIRAAIRIAGLTGWAEREERP